MHFLDLGLLITVFLFSKGTDSSTTKIAQLAKSNVSHSKVNVHRNDPTPGCTPSPTHFSRIEYIQRLSTSRCFIGYNCEGA